MKTILALLPALAAAIASAHAQLTIVDPTYAVAPQSYYTHSTADDIVSFDFGGNGALYYQTVTPSYSFGGLYQAQGGVTTSVAPGSGALFAGYSVVSSGQYVYYNTSDFTNTYIHKYGPVSGGAAALVASTTPNSGLYASGSSLFITGAPGGSGTNHIYYSATNPATGALLSDPAVDLGQDSGSSGPLTFTAQGDLFYAPGFGDLKIYRWSHAEVDAAIANPSVSPLLAAGHIWLDYAADYAQYDGAGGGTSMLIDQSGNLLLTLTGFGLDSTLVKFGVGAGGAYNGNTDTILTEAGRLGELRLAGGSLLLADGNQILQIVPEPSVTFILMAGLAGGVIALLSRRQQNI